MKFLRLTKVYRELNDDAKERLKALEGISRNDINSLRNKDGLTLEEINRLGLNISEEFQREIDEASKIEITFREDEYERKENITILNLEDVVTFDVGEEFSWVIFRDSDPITVKESIETIDKLLGKNLIRNTYGD